MTRPFYLTLRAVVVACANARPRRCELASLVCHFVPYQNSGVLWTYELILGVLETSDYSVYAQYRSWVLYLDTRAALGGAQITNHHKRGYPQAPEGLQCLTHTRCSHTAKYND